jgi:LuxR family maltose regulon positive regulatory protein
MMLHGGVAKGVTAGRKAVQLAAGRTDGLLPAALVAHSRALFFAGELDEAFRVGLQVLEQPGIESRVPILALARSTLALVAVEQGRLAAARRHADEAKIALAPIGSGRTWLGANVSAANGAVRAAEGKLVEAETDLAAAAELFADEVATVHEAWLLILLARVSLWRGRLGEAAARLDAGREVLHELEDSGRVPALADDVSLKLEHAKQRARSGEMLQAPSDAERAVLELLVAGLTIRQIAEQMFLSPNTIRSHTRALYQKLGVHTRPDLVARATELALVQPIESSG